MRYILFILFVLALLSISCRQKEKTVKSVSASVRNTYIDSLADSLKPEGWVSDFGNVFTATEYKTLDSIIAVHEKKTSNEIAIVTIPIDTNKIDRLIDFEKMTLKLMNKWGVGKAGKNNGVGLLFDSKNKFIRIEVGYGLETKLSNNEAGAMIDVVILPHFKKGNYYNGILEGLNYIIREIE